MSDAIRQYRQLREQVDRRVAELLAAHSGQIACRPGCCDCCTNLTVFPVEYDSILEELRAAGRTELAFDPAAECGFLREGRCEIYDQRPLICRTHGLPIAFRPDPFEPEQVAVSFCPKNFAGPSADATEFGPDNTLDLDGLNERLWAIHMRHAAGQGDGDALDDDADPPVRIELRQLCRDVSGGG